MLLETFTNVSMKSLGTSWLYNYVQDTEHVFLESGTKVTQL
jgi:hypothetical protein